MRKIFWVAVILAAVFICGVLYWATKNIFKLSVIFDNSFVSDDVSYDNILKGPKENWLTYAGDYTGRRFSSLIQIDRANANSLVPKWVYNINGSANLRTTPLVYNGVMYVTNVNGVYALNAVTGEKLWFWTANPSPRAGLNRGVALLDDKIYVVTDDCQLVALERANGKVVWKTKYADTEDGYYATLAPLALKNVVIAGVSSSSSSHGKSSGRGFLAAFSPFDGKEVWRFWTVPQKGEPGFETWGNSLNLKISGGASTWINGTYDAGLNLIFWPTGNPRPSYEGDVRPGDNLYSDSVLAIDPDNGKLKWYFQFYPHDTHDWDASEYPVLADLIWGGQPRKLLMQANRNGFFYVLDRTNGQFLLGKPFVKRLTWASGLDASGRPILIPGMEGYNLNSKQALCPWVRGATNWMSPSFNPETELFYVVVLEQCGGEKGNFYLKAIDPKTAEVRWECPMPGPGNMSAGTLSTAGGLVFAGDDSGHLIALDAYNGRQLWRFSMGRPIFASPMTYAVDGRQYVSIAAGSDIFTFTLFSQN